MFSTFKKLSESVKALVGVLAVLQQDVHGLLERMDAEGTLRERVDALERTRAVWESEVQGVLLKAEGQFKAARSAEERARTKEKNAQALADSLDQEGFEELPPEYRDLLQGGDVEGSGGEGVPAVHPSVEMGPRPSPKTRATLLKFGQG